VLRSGASWYVRGLGLGVEVGELLDVELAVAVLVELGEQVADLAGGKVEWRTLKDASRLVETDVAVTVTVILLEPRHHLHLPATQRIQYTTIYSISTKLLSAYHDHAILHSSCLIVHHAKKLNYTIIGNDRSTVVFRRNRIDLVGDDCQATVQSARYNPPPTGAPQNLETKSRTTCVFYMKVYFLVSLC